jgi:2-polyprenyl-3-methyl-5-hydroxy-6-metoxy-1,4-benzoquinol methylase
MNERGTPRKVHADPADAVEVFYDDHPYPPPVADLDRYREVWSDPDRLRVEYHLMWPRTPYRQDLEILVAGCGTSQAAKHALRQPTARVTGIDVSATSLRHTRELKRRYGLKNLEVRQLPIERARELGRRFDKVVCTGVLHHLADPYAGLRALRSVLKPDGAMYLMVYATYGRAGIYMLQEYCRRLQVGASQGEIEDLIAVLRTLPDGHPLARVLREAPDMRHPDALADALLHPRDRAYTVPRLFDYVEQNGCRFGRWYRQAQYLPQCGAPAATPHAARLTGLPAREQYAAVELYRGTIARHSFIAYRDDHPGDGLLIRTGDDWQSYVPLRQPRTICVQKNLPPGAAGVLINQAHTYTDLILPIDRYEKRLFEAIDGRRTIAQIVERTEAPPGEPQRQERARAFFERLWWYDQVVFDATEKAHG